LTKIENYLTKPRFLCPLRGSSDQSRIFLANSVFYSAIREFSFQVGIWMHDLGIERAMCHLQTKIPIQAQNSGFKHKKSRLLESILNGQISVSSYGFFCGAADRSIDRTQKIGNRS
jgi:hypothetical protein